MANSDQKNDTKTEDSRVVATDEGFAVGRGSNVVVNETADGAFETVAETAGEAFDTVESMSAFLQQVAEQSVSKAAATESRAFNFASQALTQQQSDMKEIMDTLLKKGVPLAIAAWAAVKIWGKK